MHKCVRNVLLSVFALMCVTFIVSCDNDSNAQVVLNKFAGEWGCSLNVSPNPTIGETQGVLLLSVDNDGNLTGTQTVATTDPFSILVFVVIGTLTDNGDGSGDIIVTLETQGIPVQTGDGLCVGMWGNNQQGFFEMRCLDANEDITGAEIVALLECKRQDVSP